MKTNLFTKKFRIPTYGGKLWVIVHPNIKTAIDVVEDMVSERIHYKDQRAYDSYTYSLLHDDDRYWTMIFLKPNAKPGTIAHECKHAVNHIFSYRGTKLSLSNDEHECYFLEWMIYSAHRAIDMYKKQQ